MGGCPAPEEGSLGVHGPAPEIFCAGKQDSAWEVAGNVCTGWNGAMFKNFPNASLTLQRSLAWNYLPLQWLVGADHKVHRSCLLPDLCVLVYEYLPNGSLEDRLSRKDNTPPPFLANSNLYCNRTVYCAYLHSFNPHSIVHGDLKPANILLYANHVCKLSYFGISCVIQKHEFASNNRTIYSLTDPKSTFGHIDPKFLATGELTPKSDVYAFGIILLQLLTGRPALGITEEVQDALDNGNFKDVIDPTAGNWPFLQASQLARSAIRCYEPNRRSQPNVASEVSRLLEPMRVSCGAS